jgi:hypothetical protein
MDSVNYKKKMLNLTTEAKIARWLKNNPMPKDWEGQNIYSWAYTEMTYNEM